MSTRTHGEPGAKPAPSRTGEDPPPDGHEREIVALTLRVLYERTGRHADRALAAAIEAFTHDFAGASNERFLQVSGAAIRLWYVGAAHPNEVERLALWRRLREVLGKEPAVPDPGGWSGDTTVLELARLADSAAVGAGEGTITVEETTPASGGAETPTIDEPASAGAEPFATDEPVFGGPRVGAPMPEPPAPRPAAPPRAPPTHATPPHAPVPTTRAEPPQALPKTDFLLPPRPIGGHGEVLSREVRANGHGEPARQVAPAPRWIQGSAWRPDATSSPARALVPARWNLLAIHIGPSSVKLQGATFPDTKVDFSQGDVTLTVQLELAGARVAAWVPDGEAPRPAAYRDDATFIPQLMDGPVAQRKVDLPDRSDGLLTEIVATPLVLPATGDSTIAFFLVCPQAGLDRVRGRLAILHNNRVLQTARVSMAASAETTRGDGLVIVGESTIHSADDVARRSEYDVAIQVSDVGGKLHLVVQHGDTSLPVQLADLAAPIERLCDALGKMAAEWDYTKAPLEQPVFGECLFTLASNGAEIGQHLRNVCGDEIDQWQRIHLVPVTSEFFPLEYVYDGLPPKAKKSKPCPNLFDAMEAGGCDAALKDGNAQTSCPNQRDALFVCPMHFWGFRRLIERNGTVRTEGEARGDAVLRTLAGAVPGRQPYGKVRAALLGATDRAFLYLADETARAKARADLLAQLRTLFGTEEATDWDDWRVKVKTHPNLLVLLVHTDTYQGARVLEIGDEDLLTSAEIRADVSGAATEPQLLLLIGCSAADVKEDFQPYPERFRDAGVSIVLAPIAPIRGEEAVRIAALIAERIARQIAAAEPLPFGELLPRLRRDLLRAGHPAVLGLVGFGDGDWELGGA